MKRILYVLSLLLDIVLLPIIILGGFIYEIIYSLYWSIKYNTNIIIELYGHVKIFMVIVHSRIKWSLKVHKERILYGKTLEQIFNEQLKNNN